MRSKGLSIGEAVNIIETKASHLEQDFSFCAHHFVGEEGSFWKGKQRPCRNDCCS
jgi:hypothetical protein